MVKIHKYKKVIKFFIPLAADKSHKEEGKINKNLKNQKYNFLFVGNRELVRGEY